jgi:Asp/Glu/hydantoin racemase
METNRQYGYLNQANSGRIVRMQKGQNIAGFPIGIIYIDDVYYPMLPGNIVNGYTFDFPVRLKAVEGLDIPNLFAAGDEVFDQVMKACLELRREGVRAISAACGFFGNYQDRVARAMDIPVAISSLVQIPWIGSLIRPDQKIGVLTADKSSLSERLLDSCGISDALKKRLVVKDLRHEREFSCILEGRGEFDNAAVLNEVVGKAREIVTEYPDTGAILLECSDMPPYAYAVQEATQLPVFDFTTLIRYLHSAVCQKPYAGFI